jgi:hypothetical protein
MIGKFAKVENDMLLACDEAAKALMGRLDYGIMYDTEVLLNQDDEVLRKKIFATIGSIAKVLWLKPDELRAQLLFQTGHYKLMTTTDNKLPVINVQSMSRRGMSDRDLRAFWHEAEKVIRERIIPTLDDAGQQAVLACLEERPR